MRIFHFTPLFRRLAAVAALSVFLIACVASSSIEGVGVDQAQAQVQTAAAGSHSSSFTLGINVVAPEGNYEPLFQKAQELGFRHIRTDWRWDWVEKTKGHYDWSAIDRMVNLAGKYGLKILPIVHYAPKWAAKGGKKPDDVYEMAPKEEAFGDYARFLAASIDRYPSIQTWQIWNEPNHAPFWGPKPDSKAFVRLMQAVNDGVGSSRRSRIKLMHAGLSKADTTFMWHLWDRDPDYHDLFDIFAVHPYFFNPKGGVRDVADTGKADKTRKDMGFVGGKDHGHYPQVFDVGLFMRYKLEAALKKQSKALSAAQMEALSKKTCITEIGFLVKEPGTKKKLWWHPYAVSTEQAGSLLSQTLSFTANKLTDKPFGQGVRGDVKPGVECVYLFTLITPKWADFAGDYNFIGPNGKIREPMRQAVVPYLSR